MNPKSSIRGFTLVELLLVIGIMTVLLSLGGLAFANIRSENNIDYFASQVKIELVRAQRQTANGNQSSIYFESNRYILFAGPTYIEADPGNQEIALPSSHTFTSITFPSNIAEFDNITSYPENYSDPAHVVLVEGVSGKTRTIVVNRWGVVEVK